MVLRDAPPLRRHAILSVMLLLALALIRGPIPIAELDRLAKARDVAGLAAAVEAPAKTFDVLKTNGAYDTGRFGWKALPMTAPDGTQYAVLSTALTSQDVGEFVLRQTANGWQYVPESDALGIQLLGHDFDLKFDVPNKTARLTDRLKFRSEGSGSFFVRMSPAYRVESVRNGAQPVRFLQTGGVVALDRPPTPEAVYEFRYAGVVDLPQYAGSISAKEATLVNDYWYPMVARQPVPYRIRIQPPAGWTAIAQGVKEASSRTEVRYRMDRPVIYYSVLAAPYREAGKAADGRDLRIWSLDMKPDAMERHLALMAPVIKFYDRAFGKWPFAGYGAVDSPAYGGGALEAYSFATYGGGLPEEEPHEPAHTYWGGLINNTYLKSFWNESFAVFSEGLYRREGGVGQREESRQAFVSSVNVSEAFKAASLADSGAAHGPVASTLGYGKGAMVLQMLEAWLGTETVVGAMRDWVKQHPVGKPGEWEDFEAHLRRRDRRPELLPVLDSWIRKPGFADFTAKAAYADRAIQIDISWRSEPFAMPLEILVEMPNGKRSTHWIVLKGKTRYSVPVVGRPRLVSIDPHRRAVRRTAADEAPVSLRTVLPRLTRIQDHPNYLKTLRGSSEKRTVSDPAGLFLVGHPDAMPPIMRTLCERAGFKVNGRLLTYRGTTVDLAEGAALAVIDLEGGKQCAIGLGEIEMPPTLGRARLVLVDRLGRFLRGVTDVKTSGTLTYRL